jgi:hypothetical protein
MAMTFRTAGAWGSGKGSNLAATEVDDNFWELLERLTTLENNPPVAVGIDHFTVSGNQLTVHLTDGDIAGPFALPSAQWRWVGEWSGSTLYFVNDICAQNGSIYLVKVQHISASAFDPDAFDSDGGQEYQLLLARPSQPYDVGMFYADHIPGDASTLLQHIVAHTFFLADAFTGSIAFLSMATTETIELPIYKNNDLIGSILFAAGEGLVTGDPGQFGTFVPPSPSFTTTLVRGDRLRVLAPSSTEDATAKGLTVTFVGMA